jgi:P-type E1-E2 ATPase
MPDYNYRKVMNASRDKVECNLKFLGLLIMENKLKSQTTGVIEILKDCNVRTVMATGDNVLTAISVARQC